MRPLLINCDSQYVSEIGALLLVTPRVSLHFIHRVIYIQNVIIYRRCCLRQAAGVAPESSHLPVLSYETPYCSNESAVIERLVSKVNLYQLNSAVFEPTIFYCFVRELSYAIVF